jgi:hypothetical protein
MAGREIKMALRHIGYILRRDQKKALESLITL